MNAFIIILIAVLNASQSCFVQHRVVRQECIACISNMGSQCTDGIAQNTDPYVGVRFCSYVVPRFPSNSSHLTINTGCYTQCLVKGQECCSGYYGASCQNECPGGANSPCSGHGICDEGMAGSGVCNCEEGYGGRSCEICTHAPWYGFDCRTRSWQSMEKACENHKCTIPGSICVPHSPVNVTCECPIASYLHGNAECLPIRDQCDHNYCSEHSSCIPSMSLTNPPFKCTCNNGYYGDGFFCEKGMKCLYKNGNCGPDSICQAASISDVDTKCQCKLGFIRQGSRCVPNPEVCSAAECESNQHCVIDSFGRNRCKCNSGFYQTGDECHGSITYTLLNHFREEELYSVAEKYEGALGYWRNIFTAYGPFTVYALRPSIGKMCSSNCIYAVIPFYALDSYFLLFKSFITHRGQTLKFTHSGSTHMSGTLIDAVVHRSMNGTISHRDFVTANGYLNFIEQKQSTTPSFDKSLTNEELLKYSFLQNCIDRDATVSSEKYLKMLDAKLTGISPATIFLPVFAEKGYGRFSTLTRNAVYNLCESILESAIIFNHKLFPLFPLVVEQSPLLNLPNFQFTFADNFTWVFVNESASSTLSYNKKVRVLAADWSTDSGHTVHFVSSIFVLGSNMKSLFCDFGYCCSGYYGIDCRKSCPGLINSPAQMNPCQGNGVCHEGTEGSGICNCNNGFVGDDCSICRNEKKFGPNCDQQCLCKNGVCQNDIFSNGSCRFCNSFDFTGPNCDLKSSFCGSVHCHVDAECTRSESNDLECKCRQGFSGDGVLCVSRNPCIEHKDQLCSENQECIHTGPGRYLCTCVEGFNLVGDQCRHPQKCYDDYGKEGCAKNARCMLITQNYECHCQHGYHGDGYRKCIFQQDCPEKNECSPLATCTKPSPTADNICECPDHLSGNGRFCYGDMFDELLEFPDFAVQAKRFYLDEKRYIKEQTSRHPFNLTVFVGMGDSSNCEYLSQSDLYLLISSTIGDFSLNTLKNLGGDRLPTLIEGVYLKFSILQGNVLVNNKAIAYSLPARNGHIHVLKNYLPCPTINYATWLTDDNIFLDDFMVFLSNGSLSENDFYYLFAPPPSQYSSSISRDRRSVVDYFVLGTKSRALIFLNEGENEFTGFNNSRKLIYKREFTNFKYGINNESQVDLLHGWPIKSGANYYVFRLVSYLPHYCEKSSDERCCKGFYGPECRPCPQHDGKICAGLGKCNDKMRGDGKCVCNSPDQYFGNSCQYCTPGRFHWPRCVADKTISHPCRVTKCMDDATCVELEGGGVECKCDQNYLMTDFNTCQLSPCVQYNCRSDSICRVYKNKQGLFAHKCICPPGYTDSFSVCVKNSCLITGTQADAFEKARKNQCCDMHSVNPQQFLALTVDDDAHPSTNFIGCVSNLYVEIKTLISDRNEKNSEPSFATSQCSSNNLCNNVHLPYIYEFADIHSSNSSFIMPCYHEHPTHSAHAVWFKDFYIIKKTTLKLSTLPIYGYDAIGYRIKSYNVNRISSHMADVLRNEHFRKFIQQVKTSDGSVSSLLDFENNLYSAVPEAFSAKSVAFFFPQMSIITHQHSLSDKEKKYILLTSTIINFEPMDIVFNPSSAYLTFKCGVNSGEVMVNVKHTDITTKVLFPLDKVENNEGKIFYFIGVLHPLLPPGWSRFCFSYSQQLDSTQPEKIWKLCSKQPCDTKQEFQCPYKGMKAVSLNIECEEGCWYECGYQAVDNNCCPGHYGAACRACPGGSQNPCNGHGICERDGCRCHKGWTGNACEKCVSSECSTKEVNCAPQSWSTTFGECICPLSLHGRTCRSSVPNLPHIVQKNCSKCYRNGGCVKGVCACPKNYIGDGVTCQRYMPCLRSAMSCPFKKCINSDSCDCDFSTDPGINKMCTIPQINCTDCPSNSHCFVRNGLCDCDNGYELIESNKCAPSCKFFVNICPPRFNCVEANGLHQCVCPHHLEDEQCVQSVLESISSINIISNIYKELYQYLADNSGDSVFKSLFLSQRSKRSADDVRNHFVFLAPVNTMERAEPLRNYMYFTNEKSIANGINLSPYVASAQYRRITNNGLVVENLGRIVKIIPCLQHSWLIIVDSVYVNNPKGELTTQIPLTPTIPKLPPFNVTSPMNTAQTLSSRAPWIFWAAGVAICSSVLFLLFISIIARCVFARARRRKSNNIYLSTRQRHYDYFGRPEPTLMPLTDPHKVTDVFNSNV